MAQAKSFHDAGLHIVIGGTLGVDLSTIPRLSPFQLCVLSDLVAVAHTEASNIGARRWFGDIRRAVEMEMGNRLMEICQRGE